MPMSDLKKKASGAFTLIELLIVVAIIAILAAIAVPNFLEAQTRSKVSRALSDMRAMRTALEAYRIDSNFYPETDLGTGTPGLADRHISIYRLTTPVSHITSIPKSPFKENYGAGGDPKIAFQVKSYLYVRKLAYNFPELTEPEDPSYINDRTAYFGLVDLLLTPAERDELEKKGEWSLKSSGPDGLDDRHIDDAPAGGPGAARPYDPTNGTISRGDIVIYSDIAGDGKTS